MIISSPMSTVLAGLKCGTKGLFNIEKRLWRDSAFSVNDVYGLQLLNCFEEKSIHSIEKQLSPLTSQYLLETVVQENTKPFFIIIRNPETLYRAQIIQSIRELCRNNNALEESIVVANTQDEEKQELFTLLKKLFPHIVKDIFNDAHYRLQSYHELVILIQYLHIHRPDVFRNLFILDLDNYSKTIDSTNLLKKFNVIAESSQSHSTKSLFFPKAFETHLVAPIYTIPYHLNKKSYDLIYKKYEDKIYTYTRLIEYDCEASETKPL